MCASVTQITRACRRRKYGFSIGYSSCLYPAPDNPIALLAKEQLATFERVEQWLRRRQTGGHIGSGSFGRDGLYSHRVAALGTAGHFITFDSTGRESTLWHIADDGEKIASARLAQWDTTGRVVDLRRTDRCIDVFLLLNNVDGGRRVALVQVMCAEDCHSCRASWKTRPVDSSATFYVGADGAILLADNEVLEV
jgi:hypothetical protein